MKSSFPMAALVAVFLGGCDTTAVDPAPPLQQPENPETSLPLTAPPGSPPGTCWERDTTPAVIETITETVLVQPAEILADGTVVSNAVYRTETHRAIVVARRDIWFETPCADVMTVEFISTLQRALKARRLFHGPISGLMDARTHRAVRRYQAPLDLDSAILSLEAAQKLGLVAVNLPPNE